MPKSSSAHDCLDNLGRPYAAVNGEHRSCRICGAAYRFSPDIMSPDDFYVGSDRDAYVLQSRHSNLFLREGRNALRTRGFED